MTSTSRREKIEAMLRDEPKDIFLRYSLGMELHSEGESEAALELFKELSQEKPPHVPAFFRSGQILAELERVSEARSWLRDGIEEARGQGDMHAAAEMSELLTELGELGE
jgi:tetratricopeptide (TPR) repeat protein